MNYKISEVVKELGLKPSKSLGQNFLYDLNITDKIVKNSGIGSNSNVLEIGPGPGALTRSICNRQPKNFFTIERDSRVIQYLEKLLINYPKTHHSIFNQDAMKTSLEQFFSAGSGKLDIISNLPYNIGTRLIVNWLGEIEYINCITVMLQKEVARRMVATPGGKEYSKISILCQALTRPKILFQLPAKAFYPPPKVDSAVIQFSPLENQITPEQFTALKYITHLLFSNRRKKIKHALTKIFKQPELLEKYAIDLESRPENLTVSQYILLSQLYRKSSL